MFRRIGVIFIFILVIAIGVAGYVFLPVKNPKPILTDIPTSKPHQHATPDGELIEHKHTYDSSIYSYKLYDPNTPKNSGTKKHPIQLDWERIDIDTVKKKYQPYSVVEMQDMWSATYNTEIPSDRRKKLDRIYPPDTWIKRNLSLGQPFLNYADYRTVLQRRIYMINRRDLWRVVDLEDRTAMRNSLQLPSEIDTWKEYEDAYLKRWIVASYQSLLAANTETVYVTIDEDGKTFSKFAGKWLSRQEKYELMMFGVIPEGIHVVYLNIHDQSLPPGVKPRFYELYLKELELASSKVHNIVSEHEKFYTSNTTEKRRSSKSKPKYSIKESFELLQELHWGEFSDDLQTLQDAISQLEKIKREGEDKMEVSTAANSHPDSRLQGSLRPD